MDVVMAITVSEAREACKNNPEIEARVRAAMRVTRNHWMLTGEIRQIKAACAAAILETKSEEDREIIAKSCNYLIATNNMLATGMLLPDDKLKEMAEDKDKLLPIFTMWQELGK